MRISVPQKLFLAFLSFFAITAVLAGILTLGIRAIRQADSDLKNLKDLQVSVGHIEAFTGGVRDNGLTGDREKRLSAHFDSLFFQISEINNLRTELPESLRQSLGEFEAQSKFYHRAFIELLALQKEDKSLHGLYHDKVERLARLLSSPSIRQGAGIRMTFAEMLVEAGLVLHDRNVKGIGALHIKEEKMRGLVEDPEILLALRQMVTTLEKGYLNNLAIIEKEEFIQGLSLRFSETAHDAIHAIEAYQERRSRQMARTLSASLFLLAGIIFVWWFLFTRHLRSFIKRSSDMVQAIGRGDYTPSLNGKTDSEDEFGDLLRFLCTMATTLEENRKKLSASEEQYRRLVESISDWVWETDAAGRCTYSSPVSKSLLGLGPDEAVGRPISSLLCRDNGSLALSAGEGTGEMSSRKGIVSYSKRSDGEVVALESNWEVITGPGGEVTGLRGVSRDVTKRLEAEREQKQLREQLLHAQKMEAVGTLAGGVAHDFNNLLQSIGGYADLLLHRGNLREADLAAVERIVEATTHAGSLTRQLLLYSRRAGTDLHTVNLNDLVTKSVELLTRTIPKMVEMKTFLSEEPPLIKGDPVQLEQVIINLAINARDAISQAGIIEIRTFVRGEPDGEGGTRRVAGFTFSDNGTGIPTEVIGRIFEPFFTTKETGKGTGLGLSMVYGIVKTHQGSIEVKSVPGEGTVFNIGFPLSESDNDSAPPEQPPRHALPEGYSGTILLVDDEREIREICEETLSHAGYKTIGAESGEKALEIYLAMKESIDLVVMDLNMPGMGGAECCRRLLELDPRVKIIIATGFSEDETSKKSLRKTTVGFLRKPYRMKTLVSTISRALDPLGKGEDLDETFNDCVEVQ